MFLKKDEKIIVWKYRLEIARYKTLLGIYKSGEVGQKKVKKIMSKIERLGETVD